MKPSQKTKLGEGSTPGPWTIRNVTIGLGIVEYAIEAENGHLASVHTAIDSDKEDKANAKLISRAPLLIESREVLEECLEAFDLADEFVPKTASQANDSLECAINCARALLAKIDAE